MNFLSGNGRGGESVSEVESSDNCCLIDFDATFSIARFLVS